MSERGDALRKTDQAFESWFNSWFPDCPWAKEPHGLVIRLRHYTLALSNYPLDLPTNIFPDAGFLHVRLLLYRAFLNLLVQGARRREKVSEDLLELAAVCIHIAADIVTLTVDTINPGVCSSGTLQGVLFHAMLCLWNALVTLLFFASSRAAHEFLGPKLRPINILGEIKHGVQVFEAHADSVPFAQTARLKIHTILEKIGPQSTNSRGSKGARTAVSTALDPPTEMTSSSSQLGLAVGESAMPGAQLDWADLDPAFDDFDNFEAFFGMAGVDSESQAAWEHS